MVRKKKKKRFAVNRGRKIVGRCFFLSNSLIPEEESPPFSFHRRFLPFVARPASFYAARSSPNVQGLNKSSRGRIKGFLIVKYCGRISVFVSHSSGTSGPTLTRLPLFFSSLLFLSFSSFFSFFPPTSSSWPACVEPADFLNVEFKIHGIYYNRHGY